MTEGKTRVLIADDHPIFRKGLRAIIESDSSMAVVAEASDGKEALSLIQETAPEVAVLDLDMPAPDGLEVARILHQRSSAVRVVFLTMHRDEALLDAMSGLGVLGYVLKDSAIAEIVGCIRSVIKGQTYISPALSHLLLRRTDRSASARKAIRGIQELTPAERRVLRLLSESRTSKQIAKELFISVRTVDHHRANICSKLDLKGSHALIAFAVEHRSEFRE